MSPKTLGAVAAAVLASAAIAPALALGGASAAASHNVILQNSQFKPGTVTIRRGESVTWLWRDGKILHNVIGHSFRSRTQTQGSFTVRFTHSGSFGYVCTVHPHMTGKVVVH